MRSLLIAVTVLMGTLFAGGCNQATTPISPTSVASVTSSSGSNATLGPLSSPRIPADVLAVSYVPPSTFLTVAVAISKGIDNAARNGNADFGIRVTVSYVSNLNTVETVDSGRVPIKSGTTLISSVDNDTVAIQTQVLLGATPPPGNEPSFSATVEFLPLGEA